MKKKLEYLTLILILLTIASAPACSKKETATKERSSAEETTPAKQEKTIYTCAMHPHTRSEKPGRCPICGMELVPIKKKKKETAKNITLVSLEEPPVETYKVARKNVSVKVRLFGTINFDESKLYNITAWVGGRIERMFIDSEGVYVKKGDHMVSLYSPELFSAQEELIQAIRTKNRLSPSAPKILKQSTLRAIKAAREKLLLYGLTPEQIKEVEKTRKARHTITLSAPNGGVVIKKVGIEGDYVKTGTIIYTVASLKTVWVELEAYESDLAWLRYGQDVRFTTDSVPGKVFYGKIALIEPSFKELSRTIPVRVVVKNPEEILRPGMFVTAEVKAEITESGEVIDKSLADKYACPMHPHIVSSKKGRCPICGMELVPTEEFGYVTHPEEKAPPIVVPASAPLFTGKRAVVYVWNPEHRMFHLREIKIGPKAGNFYVVYSGLKEGELIANKGSFLIDADQQIKAMPSMIYPKGGKAGGMHHHGHKK
ncbi:MAG: efflux RND transporter periplasmic adaptor subunit [Candidatus Dadabacteria bacterium]|nr:MAG: efflux RND transporter periplasmic adaptor subunit [Candidatus Dadabacteria bacterium]